jgi:hypothetical protein
VYLSESPVFELGDPDSFYIGSFTPLSALVDGASYTNEQTVLLSPAAKGSYLHVQLSRDRFGAQPFQDRDLINNVDTTVVDVSGVVPDLRVTGIVPATQAYSGEKVTLQYTVTNDSDQPIWRHTQYWTDKIFLSRDPTFVPDPERVTLLAQVTQANDGPLAPGASYTRDVEVTLPKGADGDYYLYVFANVYDNGIPGILTWPVTGGTGTADLQDPSGYPYKDIAYEYPLNNLGQAQQAIIYREPDLQVTDLSVPAIIAAGDTVDVSFTVTNVGNRDTREEYWWDRVYLSFDPSLDMRDTWMRDERDADNPIEAEYLREGILAVGESYTATVVVTVPFDIAGSFHVLAHTDSAITSGYDPPSDISPRLLGLIPASDPSASVHEFQGEGNNITAAAVEIAPFDAPDLQVTALTAPERVFRGQQFDISYTVSNLGGGTPGLQSRWDDLIYLSRDPFLDLRADRFLAAVRHEDGLEAGTSYTVSRTLTMPTDLATEAYYVLVVTDPVRYSATGEVFEGGAELNNHRASTVPVIVELAPATDLVVTGIQVPPQANPGEAVQFEWTVLNQSSDVPATGTWTDSLFLSTDATWDIGDRPLGRAAFTGTLDPGASTTMTLDSVLPPVAPGDYRVIVRTDIFNQINEGVNEANNRTASADTVGVAVDELQIGVPLSVLLPRAPTRSSCATTRCQRLPLSTQLIADRLPAISPPSCPRRNPERIICSFDPSAGRKREQDSSCLPSFCRWPSPRSTPMSGVTVLM